MSTTRKLTLRALNRTFNSYALTLFSALLLSTSVAHAQDNQASMARWYGQALMTGATVDDVRQWSSRIRAVTAQQVRDAAREWLDKKRSVTGYLNKDLTPQVRSQADKVEKRS